MDNEISKSVYLGVLLIMIASVLTIVMYTVRVGSGYKDSVVEQFVGIKKDIHSGTISSLSNSDKHRMPKASIYHLLLTEYKDVRKLTYKTSGDFSITEVYKPNSKGTWSLDGYTYAKTYLRVADIIEDKGLEGLVYVEIKKNSDSTFDINIEEIDIHS